jgi:hypothetical protein
MTQLARRLHRTCRSPKRKEKPPAGGFPIIPGIVDQAAINAGFGFLRCVALADDAS